jgi:hypothetical protein
VAIGVVAFNKFNKKSADYILRLLMCIVLFKNLSLSFIVGMKDNLLGLFDGVGLHMIEKKAQLATIR